MELALAVLKNAFANDLLVKIGQVLESPNVLTFSEFLQLPNVAQLQNGEHAAYFNTLDLFSSGTFKDYVANKSSFIELNQLQIKKLKQLSIVSIATFSKCIPYSLLMNELEFSQIRELEDIIIETIYSGIVTGKLDQRNRQLEIDFTIGRDIFANEIDYMVDALESWCTNCSSILDSVQDQIDRTNQEKLQQSNKLKIVFNEKKALEEDIKSTSLKMDIDT